MARFARAELTTLWRRFEALGGWLAHLSNFRPAIGDLGHDEAVKPTWVFLWMGLWVLIAAGFGIGSIKLAVSPPSVPSGPVFGMVACSLVALIVAIGMALGLRADYVPYVPLAAIPTDSTSPEPANSRLAAVALRVTGVLDAHSDAKYHGLKRRYRERPGTLEQYHAGVLRISVQFPFAGLPSWPHIQRLNRHHCGYALLEPGTVSEVSRGTAYLTLKKKPAIRLTWIYGPVILTFADDATRDDVFARLTVAA